MRFPFPSRAKHKPPQPPSHSLSQPRSSGPLPDALRTSLLALKESADAFPPLKSAVAGVLAVWEIAERAKHSKSDARGIALRTQEILNVVAEAVPDPSVIPASMLQSIERFTVLLDDIQRRMEAIALTGGVSRVMHLNRNEAALREINKRLDEAYRDFLAASALRLEVQQAELTARQAELAVKQTELALQQVGTHAEIGKVVRMTDTMAPQLSGVLFYSRLNFFLGRP